LLKGKFAWQYAKLKKAPWYEYYVEGVAIKGAPKSPYTNAPLLKCKTCSVFMGHPYRHSMSTTTAMAHSCISASKTSTPANQSTISSLFANEIPREKLTSDHVRDEILKFFISGNIPFAQADNKHFRQILSWLSTTDPKNPPHLSRKSLRSRLTMEAQSAKSSLHEVLKGLDSKISLALDAWSSRNGYAFLGMSLSRPMCLQNIYWVHVERDIFPLFHLSFCMLMASRHRALD
jgi:hypothetical protein